MSSTTTRPTLKSTNARIDALDGKLDAILAALSPSAPAKTTTRKVAAKKTAAKPVAKKVTRKARPLSRKSRAAFVKAAAKEGHDFSGKGTSTIAQICVSTGYAPKGFRIGDGYKALYS